MIGAIAVNEATIKEFFDAWAIYDQVLDNNYMFHREIYQDVGRVIAQRYAERPLAVLDLGCGSARHLAQALGGRAVTRYLGYDLSETALAHAARNLAPLGGAIELRQGDLLEGLQAQQESFDLLFSSFALHHLTAVDKTVFFRRAYQQLEEHGLLLLVDVMRAEDEHGLQPHLDRYCAWLRSDWKALAPAALDLLCDHIQHNDLPEIASELATMATRAGFGEPVEINRFGWYRTWSFEKNSWSS